MKTTRSILHSSAVVLVAALCLATTETSACGGGYLCAQAGLAQDSIGNDKEKATKAIAQLRANGQIGLDALFATFRDEIQRLRDIRASGADHVNSTRSPLEDVLDEVAQQRDALYSQLYWYTDLQAAKQMAKATGRPILSLRLLGKLSDEFSCANSRYFRTILYSDPKVSEYLRNNFILHWESERPVPRMTIDFGDGRKLERTVTGNSIHYILDHEGSVIDAVPGLFAAQPFMTKLAAAHEIDASLRPLALSERESALQKYHIEQLKDALQRWNQDLSSVSKTVALKNVPKGSVAEMLPALVEQRAALKKVSDEDAFTKIAIDRFAEFAVSQASSVAIASKLPTAEQSGTRAVSKSVQEAPLLRVMRNIRNSVARDSVRNDYLLHTKIHQWLASGEVSRDLSAVNQRVYSELFLTPRNDPWLGLEAPDGFAALQDDGRVLAERKGSAGN